MKTRTLKYTLITLLVMSLVPLTATAAPGEDRVSAEDPPASPSQPPTLSQDAGTDPLSGVLSGDPESGMVFVGKGNRYYVTGRYSCVSVRDGSSRGTCDVTTWASSCSQARREHERDISSRGDVCQHCVKGQTDRTRRRSGEPRKWIHGGSCR